MKHCVADDKLRKLKQNSSACADALIAAQNTVVAAESLGVGSCYIGDILENCERVRQLLELPKYVLPIAMVVYGYPVESQKNRKKPARFEKEYIVFENKYRRLTKEEHLKMHSIRNQKECIWNIDIKEYIKKRCNLEISKNKTTKKVNKSQKHL